VTDACQTAVMKTGLEAATVHVLLKTNEMYCWLRNCLFMFPTRSVRVNVVFETHILEKAFEGTITRHE